MSWTYFVHLNTGKKVNFPLVWQKPLTATCTGTVTLIEWSKTSEERYWNDSLETTIPYNYGKHSATWNTQNPEHKISIALRQELNPSQTGVNPTGVKLPYDVSPEDTIDRWTITATWYTSITSLLHIHQMRPMLLDPVSMTIIDLDNKSRVIICKIQNATFIRFSYFLAWK